MPGTHGHSALSWTASGNAPTHDPSAWTSLRFLRLPDGNLGLGATGMPRRSRQCWGTSMSENSTRTPPVDSRAIASKNAPASGVVTALLAAA